MPRSEAVGALGGEPHWNDRQGDRPFGVGRTRHHGGIGAQGLATRRPVVGSDGVGGQAFGGKAVPGGPMSESIAARLAAEADEAEARAEAEERGDEPPMPGQRARRQPTEASQVYTV